MHKRSRVTRSKESVVTRFEAKHFFLQLCRGKKMALNIEGAMSAVPRRYFFFFFYLKNIWNDLDTNIENKLYVYKRRISENDE